MSVFFISAATFCALPQLIPGRVGPLLARPVPLRCTSSMFWPPAPPAPPAAPVSIPTTEVVSRDLPGYVSLLALGAIPAVEWTAFGGPDALNAARLAYFSLIAVGTVYLGVQRQDFEAQASPISKESAALAPIFASAVLGGLYLVIKYTGLNPGALYQFFACLLALLACSDLLQPFLGLALSGELGTEQPLGEARESEVMERGAVPAIVLAIALVAAYLQGPLTTGGSLSLPVRAAFRSHPRPHHPARS